MRKIAIIMLVVGLGFSLISLFVFSWIEKKNDKRKRSESLEKARAAKAEKAAAERAVDQIVKETEQKENEKSI